MLIGTAVALEEFESVYLWPDGAPNAVGEAEQDKPRFTLHPAPEETATGAAVIVNPGGGYRALAADHEGLQVARVLNDHGISAFVLRYRLMPEYQPAISLMDAQRAVRHVRHHAQQYNIDPDRIGMLGFSAGGHLTTAVATADFAGDTSATDPINRVSARPNFVVPVYAVVSKDLLEFKMGDFASTEKLVTADTPPAFLVHTHEDTVVNPMHSIVFYEALLENGVQAEMHIFQRGAHGLGLAPQDPSMGQWPSLLIDWMRRGGWLTDVLDVVVEGVVLIDGEPLYSGAVTFLPDDPRSRTAMAGIRRGKDGSFKTSPSNSLSEGRYTVLVHRFALDRPEPRLGTYSISGAEVWTVPETVQIREGMDPLALNINTKN
jgi:acetyl esterase/lipase